MLLCRHSDPEIVLKYAGWALERDEKMAIRIFTERETSLPLTPSKVLEFLSPFPVATISYLEHSIFNENSKVSM